MQLSNKILTLALLCAATTQQSTFAGDLPEEVRLRRLPIEAESRLYRTANPAAMWYMDSISLAEVHASAEWRRTSHPDVPQTGTGDDRLCIGASAYRVLSPRQRLWGHAAFTTGRYRDIRYSDAIDYTTVAPYVLGDSVGGDMSTRRYTLGGGYAYATSRLTLGVSLDYRAEIASRDHDPRVKTIVSDLNASLGASLSLPGAYIVSAAAFIESYTQNCEVDFYIPLNDIQTYPYTGMGTRYDRFAGNTNKSTGHESTGYGASATLFPGGRSGLYVSARFKGYRMNMRLRGFNNITMAYTDNTEWTARAAYRLSVGRIAMMPEACMQVLRRKGTENLFGTAIGSSYDKIGSRSPYRHDVTFLALRVPVRLTVGHCILTASPFANYLNSKEKYIPARLEQSRRHLSAGASLDLSVLHGGKSLWEASLSGSNDGAAAAARVSWPMASVLAWSQIAYRYDTARLGSDTHFALLSFGTTF